jgi:outer membrane lipoprotein carrier protein
MKKYLLLFLLFFTLTACADTPAQELAKLMAKYNTMRADFLQTVNVGGNNKAQSTSGWMALARPGKFRWEVTQPNKQLIIADGKYLWVYDADLEQATKHKLDYQHPDNPALLLTSPIDKLQNDFTVTKQAINANQTSFTLSPKKSEQMFQSIKLEFANGDLKTMKIADNLGQQSQIEFTNLQANTKLPAAIFVFKPPQATDIIIN